MTDVKQISNKKQECSGHFCERCMCFAFSCFWNESKIKDLRFLSNQPRLMKHIRKKRLQPTLSQSMYELVLVCSEYMCKQRFHSHFRSSVRWQIGRVANRTKLYWFRNDFFFREFAFCFSIVRVAKLISFRGSWRFNDSLSLSLSLLIIRLHC